MEEKKLKFLGVLESKKPHLYERFMMQELGIPQEDEKGEIGKFKETLGALQEVGAFRNPEAMDNGGMFGGMMKDIMPIVALGVLGMVNPNAAQMMQKQLAGALPGAPDQQQIEAPPPEEQQPMETSRSGGGGWGLLNQIKGKGLSFVLINKVKGKSPAEAAALFIDAQEDHELARELVAGFCDARDTAELNRFIEAIITAHPEFRDFFEWAVKQPWDGQKPPAWFVGCIQEVRAQVAEIQSREQVLPPNVAATGL